MTNRTRESLNKMFNQSRLKKERLKQQEKERKRKEKLQLKKAKQLMQKTLLKYKKIEEEKEKKKQEKIERKKLKSSYYYFKINHTYLIERDTDENELYTTFNELMEAQERGEGRINVEKWKEIVELTKEQLNQS